MSESAFGVDHGDVSKAFPRLKALGGKVGEAVQSKGREMSATNTSAAFNSATDKSRAKFKRAASRGASLERAGGAMVRNPGKTGAAVVGTGVGAVGGAGYAAGRKTKNR